MSSNNFDSDKPSLHEYRIQQLEESHNDMRKSLIELNDTVRDLVVEIRVNKRFVGLCVVLIGLVQPIIFYVLTHHDKIS